MADDSLSAPAAAAAWFRRNAGDLLILSGVWIVASAVLYLLASGHVSPRRFQDEFLYWALAKNFAAGNGWVFVDRMALFTTLGPLLGGQAGAALPAVTHPASAELYWTCVVLVELFVVVVIGWAVKLGLDRWGPARLRGMATAAEAEALLGRTRLRRHARVIRPDLYGAPRGPR